MLLAGLVFGGLAVPDDMTFTSQPNAPSVFLEQAVEPDNDETKVFDPQDACLGGHATVMVSPFTAAPDQFVLQCSVLPGASPSLLYQLHSAYRI